MWTGNSEYPDPTLETTTDIGVHVCDARKETPMVFSS